MKKLLVCLFITAFLPIAASPVQNSSTNSTPFPSIAFAGHSVVGGWCECGSSVDCICDPGETPNGLRQQGNINNSESPDEPITEPDADLGSIALLFAFMALTLFRLRA